MRISRSTGALSGLILVLLGLWGGAIPFVGPYFGYAFGSHATWHYSTNRLALDILPGLVVVAGGAMLMVVGNRLLALLGSGLAMAGGFWFAIGPAMSRLWEHGVDPIGRPLFGSTRQMLELIGYFYGLGALIVGIAAFALGRVAFRPALRPAQPAPQAETPALQPEPSDDRPITASRGTAEPTPESAQGTANRSRQPEPTVPRAEPTVPQAEPTAQPVERDR